MHKIIFPATVLLFVSGIACGGETSDAAALQDPRIKCLQMGADPLADEAIRICTQALASEKKQPGETALFYLYRGNAYVDKDMPDQAYADYQEAIKLDQNLPEVHYRLGMLLLDEGDYPGAEEDFNKALAIESDYSDALEILARIKKGEKLRELNFASAAEAEERGDFRAAAYLYTELLESDALAGARFPTFAVYDNRANVHLAQKQLPAAVKDFTAALELNPGYPPALYNRASAYSLMGSFDLGVIDYTRVIQLQPENASAYYNRGNAYAGMNRYQSAIRDYKKALELKPGWKSAENTLAQAESISGVYEVFTKGIAAEKRGAYDEAIARYNEVLESGKLDKRNSANIYYARARVHMRRQEIPETLRDLRRAVELNPRWKALRETLKAVEAEAGEVEEQQEEDEEAMGSFLSLDWFGDSEEQEGDAQSGAAAERQQNGQAGSRLAVEKITQLTDADSEEAQQGDTESGADETGAVKEANQKNQKKQKPALQERFQPGDSFRDCDECPEMVVVPAGSFRMGDITGSGSAVERPVHEVTIGYALAVSRFEATYAQWDACVADDGCGFKPADDGLGRGERPVTGVSWLDAQEYLAWIGTKTGKQYRLPTEAEWEYVARANSSNDVYWEGDDKTCQYANGADRVLQDRDPQFSFFDCKDGYVKTAPVGSFLPNTFGVHDIYGNVAEWVEDCWSDSYMSAPEDGGAVEAADCERHVLRGGSWKSGPGELRAAYRTSLWKELRINTSGLRVVRSLPQQPESTE